MKYTAQNIASVKALYQNLVQLNLITIEELDAFGEPIAHYKPEATQQLVTAISECKGFSWRCHLENAGMTIADSLDKYPHGFPIETVMGYVKTLIEKAAMLELTESLFPVAELNSMLKDHSEYLDLVQDYARRGRLFAEEMDDSKERVADQRNAA